MFKRSLLFSTFVLMLSFSAAYAAPEQIPVPNTVTMLDLGAKSCVPCKMMAPVLEKVGKYYEGKASILFVDVWENPNMKSEYGIQAIPTQIFYDKKGNERERHTGFLDEASIKTLMLCLQNKLFRQAHREKLRKLLFPYLFSHALPGANTCLTSFY